MSDNSDRIQSIEQQIRQKSDEQNRLLLGSATFSNGGHSSSVDAQVDRLEREMQVLQGELRNLKR